MKKLYLLFLLTILALVAYGQTSKTIHVETAGTLPSLISDDEKYTIEELTLTGEINGTDFGLLRRMAGRGNDDIDHKTNGKMTKLNLSGVKIVAGGDWYLEGAGHYTRYKCLNDNELPESVFFRCNLINIILPESLTSIGTSSLSSCSKLESVIITDNVTTIKKSAFSGCNSLTSIIIPKGVTSIEANPFSSDDNLKSIKVSVENPVYDSREDCNAVINKSTNSLVVGCANTIIPNGVLSIGESAFYGISSLSSIVLPQSVISIDQYAFYYCPGLSSIEIPDKVTSIGKYAFYNCTGISTVNIPNSVTSIGDNAFSYCKNLISVSIGAGLSSITSTVFGNCPLLSEINIDAANQFYSSVDGVLFNKEKTTLIYFPVGKSVSLYPIPNSVKTIGDAAFKDCTELSAVSIPEGITSIGKRAFMYCSNLVSINIPSGVTSILEYTFAGCASLNSITIPTTVSSVGKNAFEGCKGLISLNLSNGLKTIDNGAFGGCGIAMLSIPSSVTSIGASAFTCKNISSISSAINEPFDIDESTFLYDTYSDAVLTVPQNTKSLYRAAKGWKSFLNIVEEGESPSADEHKRTIQLAEAGTLSNYISESEKYLIKELTISGELNGTDIRFIRDMAGSAYNGQNSSGHLEILNMQDATIVEGGEKYLNATMVYSGSEGYGVSKNYDYYTHQNEIGAYFMAGTRLTSLVLPRNVTSIANYGLFFSNHLTSVVLPEALTSIGDHGFDACGLLKQISIPDHVASIGKFAFDCYRLENIEVSKDNPYYSSENGVLFDKEKTTLIKYPRAKSSLVYSIPNSVAFVDNFALYYCRELTSLEIPSRILAVGSNFLFGCEKVVTVLSNTKLPITVGSDFFPYRSNATLYVPSGCKAVYEAADYWKEFKEIIAQVEKDDVVYTPNNEDHTVTVSDGGESSAEIVIQSNISINGQSYEVTAIGDCAFQNNELVVKVTIPETIASIGSKAFAGCTNLKSIYIYVKVPINLSGASASRTRGDGGTSVFSGVDTETCVLYVPAGSADAYRSADGWKEFTNIVEMASSIGIKVAKGMTTYTSEHNLDFSSLGDDVKAYVATGYDYDKNTIWLTRVKDVPAGTPILVQAPASETPYDIPVKASSGCYYKNMLVGNLSGGEITLSKTTGEMTNYYLSDGVFKTSTGSNPINPGKCYLQIPTTPPAAVVGSGKEVTLNKNGFASFCANEDLDFSDVEGLKAYAATGYDDVEGTIWLTRVKRVSAGTGLLLMGAASGNYTIPSTGVKSYYANMMVGNTGTSAITIYTTSGDMTNYYLNGNQLKKAAAAGTAGNRIDPGKAYMQIPTKHVTRSIGDDPTENLLVYDLLEQPEVISMQVMTRGLDGDGDTTGIHSIENGELEMENDVYYNLQGQRVDKPTKGLYIRNGKKVVIK